MIRIEPWAYFFAAALVLILPLDWLLSMLLAAFFHELCHIIAIKLLGGRVASLRIGIGGAMIETEIPGKGRELISTLAGPLGSFCLLAVCRIFPKLAICSCIQGLFNLLPVYPLDGGRILRCGLELICPTRAETTQKIVERLLYIALMLLTVTGIFLFSMGVAPLFVAVMLTVKAVLRKRPCKQSQIRLQ